MTVMDKEGMLPEGYDTVAYWNGEEAGCLGTMGRWREALTEPIPRTGVLGSPEMEKLYRETEALRASVVLQKLLVTTELLLRVSKATNTKEMFAVLQDVHAYLKPPSDTDRMSKCA